MKINKIVLYNFNSYEGVNELDFSNTDQNKNIILIGGKNGAGKTSLFTAIKIALYGPLAFGYVGVNPRYITKIKDCINSKAFQNDKVESYVQITISLMVEREIREYEITREWDYSKQKLVENYYVRESEKLLDEQDVSYFQNFLQGLIPPDLFEFFLFDGEEVGSIFSTSTYNSYVRNAVYTLCGLDIFEIIRKRTTGYIGKAKTEDETRLFEEYEKVRKKVEELQQELDMLNEEIAINLEALEQVETDLIELETAFKNAGGITEIERKRLAEEVVEAERVKAETSAKLKIFIEGLMPFFIVNEFTGRISKQLDFEEKGEIFSYIQQKLNRNDIVEVLAGGAAETTVDALMDMLLTKFKPEGFVNNSDRIHDLSKEDAGRVNAIISSLDNFDINDMIQIVKQKQAAAERTMEINKSLKSAMTDDDAAKFAERENKLLKRKEEISRKLYIGRARQEELSCLINEMTVQRERMWQNVKSNAQSKHVFHLSKGLSNMMETLLSQKTISIKRQLEKLIVSNLQHIYRKNNLITHIEIDEDFQFNLYQDAEYSAVELTNLMQNLGKDDFAFVIGIQGQELLYKRYFVNNMSELQKALSVDYSESIVLYKNIDLNRLSKGERQIFILSLYWAIIELSGQDIPFIIDTPYARIDANHRKEISEKFFPNISKQVIILSTDEEINEEYYEIIKPYISREYLLINDENQNRTSIEKHYFFGA